MTNRYQINFSANFSQHLFANANNASEVSAQIKRCANAINVHHTSVRGWAEGVQMPNLKRLVAIAEYFNCSLDELVFTDYHLTKQDANINAALKRYYKLPGKVRYHICQAFSSMITAFEQSG